MISTDKKFLLKISPFKSPQVNIHVHIMYIEICHELQGGKNSE